MKSLLILVLVSATPLLAQDCHWDQRFSLHNPDAVLSKPVAYDEARGLTLICKQSNNGPETWAWNGEDWALVANSGPGFGAMVYDSERQVVVLLGGKNPDTWEWDGVSWEIQHPAKSPHWRTDHAMAYDSKRGVVLVYGGVWEDEDHLYSLTDTWEYDGATWTQVADGIPDDGYGAMAYDQDRGVTVLRASSGVWEWDGEYWTKRTANDVPPGGLGSAMVYDSTVHACVLFGGGDLNGIDAQTTWAWDGQTWSRLDADNPPPRRRAHAMAYDSARRAVVLYGGKDNFNSPLTDTWELFCSSPPCYADLDGNGSLDLFDFLAFVNLFNAGGDSADCDGSGSLDLFDFLCFTNAFNAGC